MQAKVGCVFDILLLSGFSLQSVMLEHGYDDFVALLALEFGVVVLAERCCGSLTFCPVLQVGRVVGFRRYEKFFALHTYLRIAHNNVLAPSGRLLVCILFGRRVCLSLGR